MYNIHLTKIHKPQSERYPDLQRRILKLLLTENPQSALGQRELARTYYDNNMYRDAVEQYGKYVNNPNHFGSKHHLIEKALDYMHSKMHALFVDIFLTSPDIITALSEMFHVQGEMLSLITIDFFHDMDTLYPEIKQVYEAKRVDHDSHWSQVYNRGVEEGVLRPDVNYPILLEMMHVQMEALKRMEDHFDGQFTLEEIFNTINGGFLRSIASEKGLRIIDNFKPSHRQPLHDLFTD